MNVCAPCLNHENPIAVLNSNTLFVKNLVNGIETLESAMRTLKSGKQTILAAAFDL